jgi:23S rRNA (cytosine1962-C5)-methyltransferase
MLTLGDEPADESLLRLRLQRAIQFRESLQLDASAFRLVHGEADLLPSLVVDRYAGYLVVQALSQGMDRLLPTITSLLQELLSPAGILARNDPKVRVLEGLEQTIADLAGAIPDTVTVREGPIEYQVDLRRGQKTGLFLDQRENREAAARYARGRLLDAFSYHGGFALRLAAQCSSAEAIDISTDAVQHIQVNAVRNSIRNLGVREENVFDALRRLEKGGERFDTIVLDPPAFAKNKVSVPNALAGYKEINLRAMRLLQPGGTLVTCSCSYNVNEDLFGTVLHEASIDSHTPVTLVEKRMQGRDHPVLVGVPETHYLKCFILRRVE